MIPLIVPFHFVFAEVFAGGYPLFLFISEKETGKGFTRLMNVIFACFLWLSYFFGKSFLERNGLPYFMLTWQRIIYACLLIELILQSFGSDIGRSLIIWKCVIPFTVFGMVAILFASYFSLVASNGLLSILFFISIIVSSLFLGAASLGMLFGHWYLVKPKMPLDPFKKLTLVFFAAAAAQLVVAAFYAAVYFLKIPLLDAKPLERLFHFSDLGIFFIFRLIIGTFASLLLSYLTYTTLADENIRKINRTRAATGLLYIAILSAFTGELLGKYLFWVTKIPL